MQRAFPLLSVVLFSTAACGGAIAGDDPTSAAAASPPSSPASSAEARAPEPPSSAASDAPRPVASGADVVTVRYAMLGEKRSQPDDECSPSARAYEVDLRTWRATASICGLTNGAEHAAMHPTNTRTLDEDQRLLVRDELARLSAGTMPSSCGYDGPAFELETFTYEGSPSIWWDEDYDCQHRTTVRYLATSLRPLQSLLDSILLPGG